MTFFTLIALLYFVKNKVDFAVVEVGMGGRLDATNVLTPLVAVITNVSKEHTQYLGKSLMEIAEEKAGIIKPNTFLITGVTQPKILAKFRSHCQKRRCIMYCFGKEIKIKTEDFGGLNYQGIFSSYTDLKIGVTGKYQVVNAALALGVTEVLRKQGFQISEEAIREGLREMKWPGRLELICQKPRVLLDGAHNPAGIKRLVDELKNGFTYKRLFLVIGIMQDKAIKSILNQIIPLGDYVIFTQPKIDRAASPFLLFKAIEHFNKKAEVITEVSAAVKKAMSLAVKEGDLVCVTGSLFVVGEARKIFSSQVEV
jgi:dihydrofolate synthase/folylpolyglutamate synthase